MRKSSAGLRVFVYSVILVLFCGLSILLNAVIPSVSASTPASTPTVTPHPTTCTEGPNTHCPPPPCVYCVIIHDWVFDPGAIPAFSKTNYEFEIYNALPVTAIILDSHRQVFGVIEPGTTGIFHLSGPGTFSFSLASSSAILVVSGISSSS